MGAGLVKRPDADGRRRTQTDADGRRRTQTDADAPNGTGGVPPTAATNPAARILKIDNLPDDPSTGQAASRRISGHLSPP
ncbi:hypothetical protein BL254_17145 [Protofrankia sp. BMG5.30]|nr:hypothetical protein BL254_17145 [Protofrankia sp. BMG5.30]